MPPYNGLQPPVDPLGGHAEELHACVTGSTGKAVGRGAAGGSKAPHMRRSHSFSLSCQGLCSRLHLAARLLAVPLRLAAP